MASKIAFIIQGKTSPHYRPNRVEGKDKCVIINASHTFLTGKKADQKLYRHHTGFPGGLKEIKARHYMKSDPEEMLMRTIKGMLPKNKMRLFYLAKVVIYKEAGHDIYGLPQFGRVENIDYNKIMQMPEPITAANSVIISSNVEDIDKHCKFFPLLTCSP